MNPQQGFPNVQGSLADPDTGQIKQAWLQLLITIWNRTGGGVGIDVATLRDRIVILENIAEQMSALTMIALGGKPESPDDLPLWLAPVFEAVEAMPVIAGVFSQTDPMPVLLPVCEADSAPVPMLPGEKSLALPLDITPGASPYDYSAILDGTVVVEGGTITSVQFSRDGATFITFPVGVVPVAQGDVVRVTYAVAPTMTFIEAP